jgi:hypothetical protein
MKRVHLIAVAALAASASAYANDVDFYPNGFVSSVIQAAQEERQAGAQSVLRASDAHASATRAQVIAETREAARLGVLQSGEAGPVATTSEQEHQIKQAGLRALGIEAASK